MMKVRSLPAAIKSPIVGPSGMSSSSRYSSFDGVANSMKDRVQEHLRAVLASFSNAMVIFGFGYLDLMLFDCSSDFDCNYWIGMQTAHIVKSNANNGRKITLFESETKPKNRNSILNGIVNVLATKANAGNKGERVVLQAMYY
jgi:hypothetical protein